MQCLIAVSLENRRDWRAKSRPLVGAGSANFHERKESLKPRPTY